MNSKRRQRMSPTQSEPLLAIRETRAKVVWAKKTALKALEHGN